MSVLAIAVLAAALALVLDRRSTTAARTGGAAARLAGVTWQGELPILTMVFSDHTVRIFDGCSDELHSATIGNGVMDVGGLVGRAGVCGGAAGGPPPQVRHFDAVAFSRQLSWQRTGDTLRLTNRHGRTLLLHNAGRAPELTGQGWSLKWYTDARGYSHVGNYRAAHLRVDGRDVHASDLCGPIIGNADFTDANVTFTNMRPGSGDCSIPHSAKVDPVVRAVLNGPDEYSIRGSELIIYGNHRGLLVYQPSH